MTAEQMRAARALLRLDQQALSQKADVSIDTIKRFEAMHGKLKGKHETIQAIRSALEYSGIEFIDGDAKTLGGDGVRFAVDPTQKYRNIIAERVADLTRGVLSGHLSRDLKLFDKDPVHIADLLIQDLVPLIRHAIPTTLKFIERN